jgi:octanoyl-[GcvH]:protein N-octanoyltransferase
MGSSSLRLITHSFSHRPALDTAVSRAILHRVSDDAEPATLRLYNPGSIVAFGPQDAASPGFIKAVDSSRKRGFEAIKRLAGGHAAIFHPGTIAFTWTIHDTNSNASVNDRFRAISQLIASALKRMGVDAHIGPVPGEYCSGQYSVNARGSKKIMGVGQRLALRAAHVGGVVIVNNTALIRDMLTPVYEALNLKWDPCTAGSIEDEIGTITYAQAQEAIVNEFSREYDLYNGIISNDTMALAKTLEVEHMAP